MNFSITKKGYNKSEVDDYSLQAEQYLQSQKDRINQLKNKVAALEKELEIYYDKKDLIMAALTEAVKKSEEIERQANQKYELEIQRLRQFHAKWTDYYDKLMKKSPSASKNTDAFNREMDKILRESEWLDSSEPSSIVDDSEYVKEKVRLDKLEDVCVDPVESIPKPPLASRSKKTQSLTPLERIKKYLDGGYDDALAVDASNVYIKAQPQPKEQEQILSLEDALNPKQDLQSIMRDLGLIED